MIADSLKYIFFLFYNVFILLYSDMTLKVNDIAGGSKGKELNIDGHSAPILSVSLDPKSEFLVKTWQYLPLQKHNALTLINFSRPLAVVTVRYAFGHCNSRANRCSRGTGPRRATIFVIRLPSAVFSLNRRPVSFWPFPHFLPLLSRSLNAVRGRKWQN